MIFKFIFLLLAGIWLVFCTGLTVAQSDAPVTSKYGPGSPPGAMASAAGQAEEGAAQECLYTGQVEGEGRFVGVYCTPSSARYYAVMQDIMEEGYLEWLLEDLNDYLAIPEDIFVGYFECGEANAFYNPESKAIIMCFELYDEYEGLFDAILGLEGDELREAVNNAELFVFYHELGHALIDVLDLPITGQEEDAVDQLATYVSTDGFDDEVRTALDGALSFYASDAFSTAQGYTAPLWDEHDLGQQRFFNILCWLYGDRPDLYGHLVSSGTLPEGRAVRCADEWERVESAWSFLLADNFRYETDQEVGDEHSAVKHEAREASEEPQFLFPISETDPFILQGYPTGFVVAAEEERDDRFSIELVPANEPFESWTHRFAVIGISGMHESPREYAIETGESWLEVCPDLEFNAISGGLINFIAFETWTQYCPQSASDGLPAYRIEKAIHGGDQIISVSMSFRYRPDDDTISQWLAFIDPFTVCVPTDPQLNCKGDTMPFELHHLNGQPIENAESGRE